MPPRPPVTIICSMRIALLSIDDLSGYVTDDELVVEPLGKLGYAAEFVPWRRRDVRWQEYSAVIIRTTWDYQNHLAEFLSVLARIESRTRLANPLRVVRWNADKVYLRKLEERGAKIVPTLWSDGPIESSRIEEWFQRLRTDEVVVKPTVSANAQDTLRLQRGAADVAALGGLFDKRSCMIQPFMRGIEEEGEFSLFYFNGEYSHAILKTPKQADFRVQEEHGGTIRSIKPTARLLAAGEKILRLVSSRLLYSRVDFVRDAAGEFALMELELIEPSLYLRHAEHAPRSFAQAIDSWLHGDESLQDAPLSQPVFISEA